MIPTANEVRAVRALASPQDEFSRMKAEAQQRLRNRVRASIVPLCQTNECDLINAAWFDAEQADICEWEGVRWIEWHICREID